MNRTLSLLFYPKKSKKNITIIYLRITINNQRFEVSTGKNLNEHEWDGSGQKVSGKSEEVRTINAYLKALEHKVFESQQLMMESGKPITTESFKNFFTGKGEKARMLIEIIKQHNKDVHSLIGHSYAIGTYKKYITTEKHISDFLKWKHNVSDINIKRLGYEFLADFEFFLKSQRNLEINTSAKYIKNLKKIIKECVSKNWLEKDPFISFKLKSVEVERGFLSEQELYYLQEKEFRINRIDLIRDLFVFSCYTGLSYIDVFNLTRDNVSIGIDGQKWIFTHRQKTETASRIPLLPPAAAIIEKYANNPKAINEKKLLPVPSNQKVNAYLKEIADCCGIKKELTFHIARHTFATTVTLSNGIPIESVSKMLGHKKIQTTQHYAKILDKKVSSDMQVLREKYNTSITSLKSVK